MIVKTLLIFSVLSFGYSNACNQNWSAENQLSEGQCLEDGLICKDCFTSVHCNCEENGVCGISNDRKCDATQTCNHGLCSNSPSDYCRNIIYRFVCQQTGIFPHPFDSSKYFICSKRGDEVDPNSVEMDCTGVGTGYYDPLTTRCRLNPKCRKSKNTPNCVNIGDIFPVDGNQVLYYMCLMQTVGPPVITPQVFACPRDLYFNKNGCVEKPRVQDECEEKGKFYDPDDCKQYFECEDEGENPKRKICDDGKKFDPWTESCVEFEC